MWVVRRDAQPRALRAAGLRGFRSSAPVLRFSRGRLSAGAEMPGYSARGYAPLLYAASVIPRPSPVSALRFAAYGGSLRARRFPAPAA